MELVFAALVVLAALGFVIRPLLGSRGAAWSSVDAAYDGDPTSLADRRLAVYREVLDLDFEHQLGKLDDSDYRMLSAACLARAASLLGEDDARDAAVDERVEREIAAMREELKPPDPRSEPRPRR